MKKILITLTIILTIIIFAFPIFTVFSLAFEEGVFSYIEAIKNEEALEAIKLSFLVAFIAIPINLIFGIAASWCIAKFEFRGKKFLTSLIDIPFSVSPVISGFIFLILFGIDSIIGKWLVARDMQFIFAVPALVLATLFVTLPYIARELIPVMEEHGNEQEEAALSLGASGIKTFYYITLPNIKWGLLYGLLLSLSRAFGEFGAVSVVSGHIRGETTTIPMHVEILYNEYNYVGAFAVASILAFLAITTLIIKKFFYKQ
ncbi:MAG: sulfate ABC transporter permease subunit CysW [Pseudomonadota bacterium]